MSLLTNLLDGGYQRLSNAEAGDENKSFLINTLVVATIVAPLSSVHDTIIRNENDFIVLAFWDGFRQSMLFILELACMAGIVGWLKNNYHA